MESAEGPNDLPDRVGAGSGRDAGSRRPVDVSRDGWDQAGDAAHRLPVHEVVLLLGTDPAAGLADSECRDRLGQYGPNVLPAAGSRGPLLRFVQQLNHPLIYMLLVAGSVAAALGENVDAAVIFGVVALNAAIGFVQESKAEAALDALRSIVRTRVRVVRSSRTRDLPSEEIVPGDLVLVDAGDKVPADLRLVREIDLEADESALTGESLPVAKDEVVLPESTSVADRRNMLYSGTLVTAGTGAGVVVATGADTELGEIHRLVSTADVLATPLTRKLARFSRILTVTIIALAALAFTAGVARGERPAEMFTAAIALAVGAIPEGLPAAVTITLAIGVARMARRRAVVRRLPAVETLGSTTVICTDKTGTLTSNEMAVRAVWTARGRVSIDVADHTGGVPVGDGQNGSVDLRGREDLTWCLTAGALCNDASVLDGGDRRRLSGDPTEVALLAAAFGAGLTGEELAGMYPRVDTIPFSSERRYMATLHEVVASPSRLVCVKGAFEAVLELCGASMSRDGSEIPLDRSEIAAAAESLAGDGHRVLACAVARIEGPFRLEEQELRGLLVFTGLQAMQDPPRPGAVGAVRSCQEAGIEVKMITGDHARTASAIATEFGLIGESDGERVVTGAELGELASTEYPDVVRRASVFARVSPEQKLRLVEGLQASDDVVAMTGDGVNDAPALRQADIGIAMGKAGTEVAKDAADLVLTDDAFSTIESAVEEGRGVFDNLVKFIVWTLPTNMAEGAVILLAILLGASLPILPGQILWINMTTAVALGLTLAFEPKEAGIMRRAPRDPSRPLLTFGLVLRTLLVSALLVGGAWWLFEWERSHGASLDEARTTAVNLFVMVEAFYLFSCRSLTKPSWRLGLFDNRWLLVGVAVQGLGQAAITYLPFMNSLFQTSPIQGAAWLRIVAVAAVTALVVALDKRFGKRPD